ncbi:MAG: ABC transporter ATP-binding protein [Firmicutes bacterium]|nr:ABC transporter ATP-binding protein [Bacillota bacterium]
MQPIHTQGKCGNLLEVSNLRTIFETKEGVVRAVNGVTFAMKPNTILGVVGESGCGKTVMAHSILRTVDAMGGRIVEGSILFQQRSGEVVDIAALEPEGRIVRGIRGSEIAMIFQEPMTAFAPVYTIGRQIMESVRLHRQLSKKEAREIAIEMLRKVSIPKPETRVDSYPHQLSGGMRQRAMIAMALACRPRLLIADEPTTALDVTIQAQILELLVELQKDLGMSIIMITHDLGVIAELATEVIVMYLGVIVEQAPVRDIFYNPKHPYTRALYSSIPRVEGKATGRLHTIPGSVPAPRNMPKGCPFHPRCSEIIPGLCEKKSPALVQVGRHTVACWLYQGGEENAAG